MCPWPLAMSVLTRGKELGAKGIHLHIISTSLNSNQQEKGAKNGAKMAVSARIVPT